MAFLSHALRRGRWTLWIGGAVGVATLVWLLRNLDGESLIEVVRSADIRPLFLIPLAVIAEQLLRAVKWRRLLTPLRSVRLARLFGAIMAGYLANLVVPVGVSPLVRAWLIARLEKLRVGTVLGTVAVDRLIDGVIFLCLAGAVAGAASFPDESDAIREGLWGGFAAGLVALVVAVAVLVALKRTAGNPPRLATVIARRLPARFARFLGELARLFAEGLVLPKGVGARAVIFGASIAMKALAASHFLWAGLAFGIVLTPVQYLFLLVFLGLLATLTGTLHIVGGFTAGAVFALGLLGVEVDKALAMVLVVEVASHLTVAIVGAAALWLEGLTPATLKRWHGEEREPPEARDDTSAS